MRKRFDYIDALRGWVIFGDCHHARWLSNWL